MTLSYFKVFICYPIWIHSYSTGTLSTCSELTDDFYLCIKWFHDFREIPVKTAACRQVYVCVIIRQLHSFVDDRSDSRAAAASAHPYLIPAALTKTSLICVFTFTDPRLSWVFSPLSPLPSPQPSIRSGKKKIRVIPTGTEPPSSSSLHPSSKRNCGQIF